MKVTMLGATLGNGISSKSGTPKPYQINSIDYLIPAKDFIQGDHNINKCGFEKKTVAMEYSTTLYNKVKQISVQHGVTEVELTLSPDPENMARNIVTDIKLAD